MMTAAVLGTLAPIVLPSPADADSLQDALRQALQSNPTLAAARSDTVAASENIVQAASGGRPRAIITTTETEFVKQSTRSTLVPDRRLNSGVSLTVPLYRSGAVKYAVKEAEQRYAATRQNFRVIVADLFAAVVDVYSNVIRDETIVRASERNVTALRGNLRAIKGRFSIGDMTVTDVSLSEARLALAEGSLQAVRAQLVDSREDYIRVVGRSPTNLTDTGDWSNLPTRVDTAVDTAISNNGALQAARFSIDAAEYRARSIHGERGLQVSGFGSGTYFNNLDSVSGRSIFRPQDRGTSAQVGIILDLPLYQGGLPASRIRQARAARSSAIEQAIALERDIVAQTRSAYAIWRSSLEYFAKAQDAIAANEVALRGAKMENNIGTRTLLDVLDIERELFNNYVTAASVRRDVNVASFRLLTLTGKADPDDLGLADPAAARGISPIEPRLSFSDWADGRSNYVSSSTTTNTIPAQNGNVDP